MKNERLRGVAVIGPARPRSAPEVPTMVESGLRDFQFTGWQGIFAPAGTPQEILAKISADTLKVLRIPDLAERLPGMGLEAAGTTPAEFAALYKSDIEKYARVIKAARIPLID
jgi:tripartite-type tricarboxylate transporter receptor subunit TctC